MSFLYFNQAERKGLFLFFSLIGLSVLLPLYYREFRPQTALLQIDMHLLDTLPGPAQQLQLTTSNTSTDSLFAFDPNLADRESLHRLGLSPKTTSILLNYRAKGGRFFRKEDLKKIYGLDENWYDKVKPFIQLPDSAPQKKSPAVYVTAKPQLAAPPVTIAINTADADNWAQLRGIGPVLSKRIVKFRDKLGGFHSIAQVQQTYGLPDSTFQAIKPQLVLKQPPRLLYINQATTEVLAQHPYISWKLARVIVNYRQAHGPFADPTALQAIYILDSTTLQQIRPYLNFCTDCPPGNNPPVTRD